MRRTGFVSARTVTPLPCERVSEASSAAIELIEEFESWSIAFPGLEVFQTAIKGQFAKVDDAREAFIGLFEALLRALPLDAPDAYSGTPSPLVQGPLSPEQMKQLKMLVDNYRNAIDEISCYVHDLTVESQNDLLSGLFERQ